jgi:hypothetical protein
MRKILLACALLGFGISASAQTVPSYVPKTGLEAWYPFNGNALDESGLGHDLQLFNGPALTTDRSGLANRAYQFDGYDDYMVTKDLFFNAGKDHTVAVWFLVNDSTQTKQTFYNTIPHRIEVVGYNWFGTQAFDLGLGNGDDWDITDDTYNLLDTFTLPVVHRYRWNQLVTVKKGLNWIFYINGVKAHTNIVSGAPLDQVVALWFGSISYSGTPFQVFGGKMDDIGIWNRDLTDAEIKTLYEGNPTSVEHVASIKDIRIFPNPAAATIYIEGVQSSYQVEVWNLHGQKISSHSIDPSHREVPIGSLVPGSYLLRITGSAGNTLTSTFTKQ